MTYNDDEEVHPSRDQQPPGDRAELDVFHKVNVPLQATNLNVLLQLKGKGIPSKSSYVDIVAVLDVSYSMHDHNRIGKLKTAMKFITKKLGPMHRLSIVTFSHNAARLCKLRKMKDDAREDIEDLIDGLSPHGSTNMEAGLKLALEVLDGRKYTKNRVKAIMLMSDGDETRESDAASVNVEELPVYTFGVGADYGSDVLHTIANNSDGGTFSTVDVDGSDSSSMGAAFAKCLAGILTVAVEDLQMTITAVNGSTLGDVHAGKYKQTRNPNDSTNTTISFGNLYIQEIRNILVNVHLPTVYEETGTNVLSIAYSYKVAGDKEKPPHDAPLVIVSVTRTNRKEDAEKQEVLLEQLRLEIVGMIDTAAKMGEDGHTSDALETLQKAKRLLNNAGFDQDNSVISMLNYELDELIKYLSNDEYDRKGCHFANASLTSHALQRHAARGDVKRLHLFVTDPMKTFHQQFTSYDNDPNHPVQPLHEETS